MADIPIPTAADAGHGFAYLTEHGDGISTAILAAFVILMAGALWLVVRYFGKQNEMAWARVTVISDARSADSRAGDDAIAKNTLALTIIAERLNKG